MKKLRSEDPALWSVATLARLFNVKPIVIRYGSGAVLFIAGARPCTPLGSILAEWPPPPKHIRRSWGGRGERWHV